MTDPREPNLDDGSSYFQKAVILTDWWLIKCSKEFNGKRFGVAGTEMTDFVDKKRAIRVFRSSPIMKAINVNNLEASNGVSIILCGFLNKERVVQSGFNLEISREFIFGFPPHWEQMCNKCFEGIPLSNDNDTVPSSIIIDKARYSVLSPCKSKNTKRNVDDCVAKSRDKSVVTEKNKVKINDKDGRSVGSRARDENTARRKSLRLRSKPVEEKTENRTNDGDDNGVTEGFDKVNEFEAFDNEGVSPGDNDVVDTSRNCNAESMACEKQKDEPKVMTRAASRKKENAQSVVVVEPTIHTIDKEVEKAKNATTEQGKSEVKVTKELETRSKSRKKVESKRSERNVVLTEPMSHLKSEVKRAEKILSMGETKRKIDFDAEVTPVKEVKKESDASSSSIGSFKRSRSGRLLMSPLEFWRNEIPVYDLDRNVIEVTDGDDETPSKGKGSGSRKPRR